MDGDIPRAFIHTFVEIEGQKGLELHALLINSRLAPNQDRSRSVGVEVPRRRIDDSRELVSGHVHERTRNNQDVIGLIGSQPARVAGTINGDRRRPPPRHTPITHRNRIGYSTFATTRTRIPRPIPSFNNRNVGLLVKPT